MSEDSPARDVRQSHELVAVLVAVGLAIRGNIEREVAD